MKTWMIIVAIVLVLSLLYLTTLPSSMSEGFLTLDPKATATQRSLLQMEGERRYNDLARVQNPSAMVSADSVDAAVRNLVPTPTSQTDSLLSVLGFTEFSAADDGTNKIGTGVEQTGMVQSKINFCESLTTIDCDLLTDPRMAECGFCHKNGVNSNGKAHRGGMFISSDDQIRANERAGEGNRATYEPTIGTCKNGNFTLMKKNCEARENAIKCQKEGAATTTNDCGQCFGSTGPGLTGFLYMGPNKLKTTTVRLTVSHPGMHMMPDGTGTILQVGGKIYTMPASNAGLLNPQSITIEIKEGDILQLNVYGIPKVWTAWVSNDANTRSIGLSLGETGMTPTGGLVIAGDSNSSIVRKAVERMNVKDQYDTWKKTVPNGVLWYQRREIMPPAVLSAYYGNTSDPSQSTQNVTSEVKKYAVAGGNSFINDGGTAKAAFLYIKLDNGNTKIAAAGTQPKILDFYNFIAFTFQMPGSLTEPYYDEDKNACPTGPLILTEIGAGLMGANSCFDSAGVFSASLSCIRNLFIGCGGTNKGTLYPKTAADAAALAQKDPATGKVAIDATVTYLNNLTNIALFGVDSNNSPVGFAKQKDHALKMLGVSLNNPCEGPALNTGPHTAECLDYLYRTSGDNSKDGMQIDPAKLPYNYCNKNGTVAPYKQDGSVNEKAVEEANQYGGVANVRAYYNSIYARSKDSSSFDAQADAMQKCFNTALKPPAVVPGECPAPNPTEWQCFGPSKLAKAEVFMVREGGRYAVSKDKANSVCQKYGARLATKDELIKAQQMGADWCSTGWVSDNTEAIYPINTSAIPGCGNAGVQTYNPGTADVNCFGRKPAKGTASENILPFNATSWYNPLSRTSPAQITLIPAISPGRVLRHSSFFFWVHPVDGSALQGVDASFEIVDALNGNKQHVSFRSINFPDRYITVEPTYRVSLSGAAGDRSCFLITAPLNKNVNMMSLQSVAYPGRYICMPRPDATDIWAIQVDPNNPNASTFDQNNGKVSPTLASWTRTISLYLQQISPFSSNQIPACLYNQNQNQVQCASNDGRTPILFTTESECNIFVSAGTANTKARAQPQPALSNAVYDFLSARV